MMTSNNNNMQNAFLSSALLSLLLTMTMTMTMTMTILSTTSSLLQVQAWTTASTNTNRPLSSSSWSTTMPTSLSRRRAGQISSASSTTTTTTTTTTALFGKKKKKDTTKSSSTVTKMQVKLLQHIAGTGQAGDIIMVNPIFFDNKLRPQKLARIITDDEVQKDIESNQEDQKQLMDDANAIKDILGSKEEEKSKDSNSNSESDYTLSFLDNQTGPDGNKLFGGIGPKKILDALKLDCKKFDVFSKEHTKLVSIIDVQEEEEVDDAADDDDDKPAKFKSWETDDDNDNNDNDNPSITFKSLPKSDKLTIKRTGQYRLKVSLTKEINVMIRVIVE